MVRALISEAEQVVRWAEVLAATSAAEALAEEALVAVRGAEVLRSAAEPEENGERYAH